jgi:hypothetical protein
LFLGLSRFKNDDIGMTKRVLQVLATDVPSETPAIAARMPDGLI